MSRAAREPGGLLRRVILGVLGLLLVLRVVGGGSPLIGGDPEEDPKGPLPMARDALTRAYAQEEAPPSPARRQLDLKPEEIKVLKELKARRESLAEDKEKLEKTRERVKILKDKLAKDLDKLKGYRDQIQNGLDREKQLKSEKMDHLVAVYSSMDPKKAAERIDRMERVTAVKLLSRMTGKSAGRILSFVEPDKANRISQSMTKMVDEVGN